MDGSLQLYCVKWVGLEGRAKFESVESTFSFGEMHAPRERRSSQASAEYGHADPGKCRTRTGEERDGGHHEYWRRTSASNMQFYGGRQLLDHVSLKDALGTDGEGLG